MTGLPPGVEFDDLADFLTTLKLFTGRKQLGRTVILRYNGKLSRQDIYPYVVPRNPGTQLQQANRQKFAAAMQAWNALSPEEKEPFEITARQRNLYGKNVYVRKFMRNEL